MRRLGELCEFVNGQLVGDSSLKITGAASANRAVDGEITFIKSEKYLADFERSSAVAAIAAPGFESNKPLIRCENPEAQFAKIVSLFRPDSSRVRVGISPSAVISPSAKISDDVDIYPGAVIGDDVEIGCGSIIYPNVTLMDRSRLGAGVKIFPSAVVYPDCVIGDRCIIHSGVVIGAYGFGYQMQAGRHKLSAQLGNVVIESDVEIGSNSTVDRGTYDSTVIGEGTKIDDQVMVGHNCQIGKHNILCSQVGIAGSCTTGDYVVMGGQVGVGDHVHISSRASVNAKSGVMHDLDEGQTYMGRPAMPVRQHMQGILMMGKLPEMRRRLKRLEKQLEQANLSSPAESTDSPKSESSDSAKSEAA